MKNKIILFHSSNLIVDKPNLYAGSTSHDFGRGFYLTTSLNQASRWSKHKLNLGRIKKKVNRDRTISSMFTLDKEVLELDGFNVKVFESPSREWLQYIIQNRTDPEFAVLSEYDIVIGPVVDGRLSWQTLNRYQRHEISFEQAIKLIKPSKLKDQWAFKTKRAIDKLEYRGVIYEYK